MIKNSIALIGLLIVYLFQPLLARPYVSADLPDLKISQYEFDGYDDKRLRVQIANEGKAASSECRLELAIRKINGSAVTRTVFETIPALKSGQEEWVTLNAIGILPSATSLKDTTFRVTADETRIVAESNEDNNETSHNAN